MRRKSGEFDRKNGSHGDALAHVRHGVEQEIFGR